MNYTKENAFNGNLNELKINEDSINGVTIVAFRKAHENGGNNAAEITTSDGKKYTSKKLVDMGVKVAGVGTGSAKGTGIAKNAKKLHENEIKQLSELIAAFGEEVTVGDLLAKLQSEQEADEKRKAQEAEAAKEAKKAEKESAKKANKLETMSDDDLLAELQRRQAAKEGKTEQA